MRIRPARPGTDAPAVAAIYRPIVEDSHISFEETAPDAAEMEDRMRRTLRQYPWLVAEDDDGGVAGYAYAAAHRERAAYRWSVGISAYLAPRYREQGMGRLLYDELLGILARQGYLNVYAGIALPNQASEALHRSLGMERIGVYEMVGHKLGRWWDVAWYGVRLGEGTGAPAEPVPFPDLAD